MLNGVPIEVASSLAISSEQTAVSEPEIQRRRWQATFNELAIVKHLGARVDLSDPVLTIVTVDHPTEFHQGGMGTTAVNGAVIAGLVDCAAAIAGIVALRGRRAGTIQLNLQFMAPIQFGSICVVSRVSRRNRQIAFCTADVLDRRRQQCASALAIVAVGDDSLLLQEQNQSWRSGWLVPPGTNTKSK